MSEIHQTILLISDRRTAESFVSTDSLGALYSSDPLVQRFHDQLYLFNVSGSRVLFVWILGHCAIPGNGSADQAAKEAVHNAPTQIPFVPASNLKSFLRREILTQWNEDWFTSTTKLRLIKSKDMSLAVIFKLITSGGNHHCPSSNWLLFVQSCASITR